MSRCLVMLLVLQVHQLVSIYKLYRWTFLYTRHTTHQSRTAAVLLPHISIIKTGQVRLELVSVLYILYSVHYILLYMSYLKNFIATDKRLLHL